ncbi:transglycosylase SLT domain-containing protein [Chromohalobacter nigrandesensis]|uniref:transglycosylase SLT domain-containing protein n=1 Tax=Chromohalobacter nigrandesensis TaxID=119863 RepID=UPI001FF301EF|nr:transglycosylase SLT domain-containing protein [Chromohalobacter nigrandesensis]MCK0746384.1 transglycosylase SLT domain-containing protein [Chromohalobacter nigrandesensis]
MLASRLSQRWLSLLSVASLGLALQVTAAQAQSDTQALDAADRAMKDALGAARDHRWSRIDDAAIDDHVLAGYVEYHRLKAHLSSAPVVEIQSYIARHADSPLSNWMRGQAQTAFGRDGRFDDLLAISDGEPPGTIRQCYYYTALLDRRPQEAAQGGRELWRVGHSQPDACDRLFDTLRERGDIDEGDIWTRLTLAWQGGESRLVDYLEDQLDSDWDAGIDALERLRGNYAAITEIPTDIGPQGQGSGALFTAAMHNFTRADTEAALEAWRKIAPHLSLSDTQRQTIEHDLAFYSMVRDVDNNLGWTDDALPRLADADLFELRVRNALADQDWGEVIDWIDAMSEATRQKAHWQYWLGRALNQRGDTESAQAAWQLAAQERGFFAFAAADKLGQPYALNMDMPDITPLQGELAAMRPSVQRSEALRRIGEPGLARSEWFHAIGQANASDATALNAYALERGWYDLAVHGAIMAQQWDALAWRFPPAYKADFDQWGQRNGVDPYLLMAISRRESSFNRQAVSPVGARGLMQLMPGTATHVSRDLDIDAPSLGELFEPTTNIRLGSAYIRDMMERYKGNRLAAAAAYNAGPNRVDRWLREASGDFDLFVERIPYRETRAYVQAVLTYRVIFESLAKQGDSQGVALLTQAERKGIYDTTLLTRNP